MLLTDLVAQVRISIRDNGTTQAFKDVIDNTLATPAIVPNNSPELSQFVTESLAEYSRYRPLKRPYTLNIEAGTTTYTLPTDWVQADMSSFIAATEPQCVPDMEAYMLPYVYISSPNVQQQTNPSQFTWYNDLQQVVLSASPVANYALSFSYFATHNPATVPAQWLAAALAPACELALRAIAADQATKLQQYRMANGKLEVDNRTIKEALLKQADEWRQRFQKEVVMRPMLSIG